MAKRLAVVQQAIFTAAETDRSADHRIVAASPGIVEFDRDELAVWGPSNDALLDPGPEAVSVNFFPLPSGSFCVSRTTPAGWDSGGCGGHRMYTHCLIASPEALLQFANHPFLLLGAAMAGGGLQMRDVIPARLEALELGLAPPPPAPRRPKDRTPQPLGPGGGGYDPAMRRGGRGGPKRRGP